MDFEIQTEQQAVQEVPDEVKTVKLSVGGKERDVRVLEFEVDWEGKKEIVQVKKMSYGDRALHAERYIKIEVLGEAQRTTVDIRAMQIHAICIATVKAPFPISEDYVTYELDGDLGALIYQKIDKFNKLGDAKKKD